LWPESVALLFQKLYVMEDMRLCGSRPRVADLEKRFDKEMVHILSHKPSNKQRAFAFVLSKAFLAPQRKIPTPAHIPQSRKTLNTA
jgi:hypothetical protein